MKHIINLLFKILCLTVLLCGVFLGYMFFKTNSMRKELEAVSHFKYEITYHINGNSDVLNMTQYENEDMPIVTRWFASYIKRMEQGGHISGHMADNMLHGEVYAENENVACIEFYYDDEAVFGIKKTMDYIIDTAEKESNVSLSMLKEVTPDGYVTFKQIQRLLGRDTLDNQTNVDFIQKAREIYDALKWVIPASGKENYFSEQLSEVKMVYCAPIAAIDKEQGAQIKFGMGQTDENMYLYVCMNDVNGCEGSDLEVLIHIEMIDEYSLSMPEVISDDIIDTLASVIQFINSIVK